MKILVFAGTTEGRKLIEALLPVHNMYICACVATEYGKEVLELNQTRINGEKIIGKNPINLEIKEGRLAQEEIQQLLTKEDFQVVIDATHPYATAVTENIKKACGYVGKKYVRLLREKTNFGNDCVFVNSTEGAVEYLNNVQGNILLTTGSKELYKYAEISDFAERVYARVLPMQEVLKSCNELGLSGKQLICMQGPFSEEMNSAMLKQLNCRYMVTKDTGKEGGAYEKYMAAKVAGATLIVVEREESSDCGMSLNQVIMLLGGENARENQVDEGRTAADLIEADWFPLFINLKNRNIAIVGAGKIAERRIRTLLKFSCNLRIIGKEVSESIKLAVQKQQELENSIAYGTPNKTIEILEKEFEIDDVLGANIVLAATNNRALNRNIGIQCKKQGILVNVADEKEECDFYFPGIVIKAGLIVGVTAQGKNHAMAKKGSEVIKEALKNI